MWDIRYSRLNLLLLCLGRREKSGDIATVILTSFVPKETYHCLVPKPQQGKGLEGRTSFSVQGGPNLSSRGGEGPEQMVRGGEGGGRIFLSKRQAILFYFIYLFFRKNRIFSKFPPKFAIFPRKNADFFSRPWIFLVKGEGTEGGSSKFWPMLLLFWKINW